MSDRRDFLKLFGVGCAVVPIIGGGIVKEAQAKLLEVPKVELVPSLSPAMMAVSGAPIGSIGNNVMIWGGKYMNLTVTMEDPLTGKKTKLQGDSFVTSVSQQVAPLRSLLRQAEDVAYGQKTMSWRLEGQFIPNEKDELAVVTQELM